LPKTEQCCLPTTGIDVGQAWEVKPHNDLLMKLHEMLNKDCLAQTPACRLQGR